MNHANTVAGRPANWRRRTRCHARVPRRPDGTRPQMGNRGGISPRIPNTRRGSGTPCGNRRTAFARADGAQTELDRTFSWYASFRHACDQVDSSAVFLLLLPSLSSPSFSSRSCLSIRREYRLSCRGVRTNRPSCFFCSLSRCHILLTLNSLCDCSCSPHNSAPFLIPQSFGVPDLSQQQCSQLRKLKVPVVRSLPADYITCFPLLSASSFLAACCLRRAALATRPAVPFCHSHRHSHKHIGDFGLVDLLVDHSGTAMAKESLTLLSRSV